MEIVRQESSAALPCPRGYVASIRIRSFKGRKDVMVHLFRPIWSHEEDSSFDWTTLIDERIGLDQGSNRGDSREVILESFTRDELEQIVRYLSARYADRLTHIQTNVLDFPIPAGLLPLRSMPEGKDMGRIRFEIVPGYPLSFSMHGIYDLSQHKPIVPESGDDE